MKKKHLGNNKVLWKFKNIMILHTQKLIIKIIRKLKYLIQKYKNQRKNKRQTVFKNQRMQLIQAT